MSEYTKEQLWRIKHHAPELYEALEGVKKAFEDWGTSAFMAYMYKSLPQLKQVLSKVRGE